MDDKRDDGTFSRTAERLNELQVLKEKARSKKNELNEWKVSFKTEAGLSPSKMQKREQRQLVVEYKEAKKAYEKLKSMLQDAKWSPPLKIEAPANTSTTGEAPPPLPESVEADDHVTSATTSTLQFQSFDSTNAVSTATDMHQSLSQVATPDAHTAVPLSHGAEELYHRGMDFYTGEVAGVLENRVEAFRCLSAAAELGDADAQCMIGFMYGHGCGVSVSEKAAVQWTRESALQGNPEAQFNLGVMYANGTGVERDHEEAKVWLTSAVSQGFIDASSTLSALDEHIKDSQQEQERTARSSSDPVIVGQLLENTSESISDIVSAPPLQRERTLSERRIAAERGDADEQYNLGVILMHGEESVGKDYGEAVKFLLLSAEQGTIEAQCILGFIYGQGYGVKQSSEEAFKWTSRAAGQGNAEAQFNLGVLHHTGKGTAKDETEARKWFEKSASQGFQEAQSNLIAMNSRLENENAAPLITPLSHDNTQTKAARGDAEAQYLLAMAFLSGSGGVEKNSKVARSWLLKSASQNYPDACCMLGFMFGQGIGASRSESRAAFYTRKAAELGHIEAQFNLGVMCERGKGVKKNDVEARQWFQKAADQGFAAAEANLVALTERSRYSSSRSWRRSTSSSPPRSPLGAVTMQTEEKEDNGVLAETDSFSLRNLPGSPLFIARLNSESFLGHHWAFNRLRSFSSDDESDKCSSQVAASMELAVFLVGLHPSHHDRVAGGSCLPSLPPAFGYPGCESGNFVANFVAFVENNHPLLSCFRAHVLHPFGRSERACLWVCLVTFNAFFTSVMWAFLYQRSAPVIVSYIVKQICLSAYARVIFLVFVTFNHQRPLGFTDVQKPERRWCLTSGSAFLDGMLTLHAIFFVGACVIASNSPSSDGELNLVSLLVGFGLSKESSVVGVVASELVYEVLWFVFATIIFFAMFNLDCTAWHRHEETRVELGDLTSHYRYCVSDGASGNSSVLKFQVAGGSKQKQVLPA